MRVYNIRPVSFKHLSLSNGNIPYTVLEGVNGKLYPVWGYIPDSAFRVSIVKSLYPTHTIFGPIGVRVSYESKKC